MSVSAPQPSKHEHIPVAIVHVPWPLQLLNIAHPWEVTVGRETKRRRRRQVRIFGLKESIVTLVGQELGVVGDFEDG